MININFEAFRLIGKNLINSGEFKDFSNKTQKGLARYKTTMIKKNDAKEPGLWQARPE